MGSFSSLGARLFFFMVLAMLTSLALNSWQASTGFSRFFSANFQEVAEQDAKAIGKQFEILINGWQSHLTTTVSRLRSFDDQEAVVALRQFVNSNPDFIAVQFFSIEGGKVKEVSQLFSTTAVKDKRFEEQQPAAVLRAIEKDSRQQIQRRRKSMVRNGDAIFTSAAESKLPTLSLATQVKTIANAEAYAVLTVWQSTLLEGLPQHKNLRSYVLDRRGRVLVSPDAQLLFDKRSLSKVGIVNAAWKGGKDFGFVSGSRDLRGDEWDGAYQRFSSLEPLAAIVEYRSNLLTSVLKDSIGGIALSGLLALTVVMLFSWIFSTQVRADLSNISEHTARMATGNFSHVLRPRRRDEIGVLTDEINTIAHGLSKVVNEKMELINLEREVQTSKFMKSTFFSLSDVKASHMLISGFYRPATVCGGDIWGHVNLGQDVELLFIGDAAGTGTQASIVSSMAYAYCQSLEKAFERGIVNLSPAAILTELNRILHGALQGSLCMTLFVAIFDLKNGRMLYSNAGHTFPVLVPSSPEDDRAKTRTSTLAKLSDLNPISLKQGGVPLGLQAQTDYEDHEFEARAGDKLFLFTDGLVECTSPEGTVWGRKVAMEQILDTAKLSAAEAKDELKRRAFKFFGSRPIDDDVTIVVAEIQKSYQAATRPMTSESSYIAAYQRVAGMETPPPPQASFGREARGFLDDDSLQQIEAEIDPGVSDLYQDDTESFRFSDLSVEQGKPSWSAEEDQQPASEVDQDSGEIDANGALEAVEKVAYAPDEPTEREEDTADSLTPVEESSDSHPILPIPPPIPQGEGPGELNMSHSDFEQGYVELTDETEATGPEVIEEHDELRSLVDETLGRVRGEIEDEASERDLPAEVENSLLPPEEVPEWRLLTGDEPLPMTPPAPGPSSENGSSFQSESDDTLAKQRDDFSEDESPVEVAHEANEESSGDDTSLNDASIKRKSILDTKRQKFRIRLPGK